MQWAGARTTRLASVTALVISLAGLSRADRYDEPVVIEAESLEGLAGVAVAEGALYRFDAATGSFVPIPYQIDERFDRSFNEGLPYPFIEPGFYDVLGEQDGILDGDDELVFLFRDASGRAPAEVPWPEGAGAVRWEIEVSDPLPGSPAADRWVYLFTGFSLPRSSVSQVVWSGAPNGTISTSQFALSLTGNWIIDQWRVAPPCGAGVDVIDRIKGRARTVGTQLEDEEFWDANSTLLGYKLGPIRAIRVVRRAASGINTILTDVFYEGMWERNINLRTHPLPEVWLYIDWKPAAGLRLFTSIKRDGFVVDGVSDTVANSALPTWTVMRGPQGGMVLLNDIPSSPLFQSKLLHYRDDASFDDRIPTNPGYGDEDDKAIGDNGFRLLSLGDSQVDPIAIGWRVYPLCQAQGEAADGDLYRSLADEPLETESTRQERALRALRSLQVHRSGADLVLTWEVAGGSEITYRVYSAQSPGSPQGTWSRLADVEAPPFVDVGAALTAISRYYSVVETRDDEEGGW